MQLLRKFASLEIENSEMKKKIEIRDERIKQLQVIKEMYTIEANPPLFLFHVASILGVIVRGFSYYVSFLHSAVAKQSWS